MYNSEHYMWNMCNIPSPAHLQGVQHALSGDNDLLGLLLHWQGADESSHFLCRLPLGQLPQPLLARPDRGVDDLQEQLPRARVEDEDGSVDGLCGKVPLKCLQEGEGVVRGKGEGEDEVVTLWMVTR